MRDYLGFLQANHPVQRLMANSMQYLEYLKAFLSDGTMDENDVAAITRALGFPYSLEEYNSKSRQERTSIDLEVISNIERIPRDVRLRTYYDILSLIVSAYIHTEFDTTIMEDYVRDFIRQKRSEQTKSKEQLEREWTSTMGSKYNYTSIVTQNDAQRFFELMLFFNSPECISIPENPLNSKETARMNSRGGFYCTWLDYMHFGDRFQQDVRKLVVDTWNALTPDQKRRLYIDICAVAKKNFMHTKTTTVNPRARRGSEPERSLTKAERKMEIVQSLLNIWNVNKVFKKDSDYVRYVIAFNATIDAEKDQKAVQEINHAFGFNVPFADYNEMGPDERDEVEHSVLVKIQNMSQPQKLFRYYEIFRLRVDHHVSYYFKKDTGSDSDSDSDEPPSTTTEQQHAAEIRNFIKDNFSTVTVQNLFAKKTVDLKKTTELQALDNFVRLVIVFMQCSRDPKNAAETKAIAERCGFFCQWDDYNAFGHEFRKQITSNVAQTVVYLTEQERKTLYNDICRVLQTNYVHAYMTHQKPAAAASAVAKTKAGYMQQLGAFYNY